MKANNTYIKFEKKGIRIGYQIYRKKKDEGLVTVYIPGFDIAYSSPSIEIARERGNVMIRHFLDYYIKNQSWREFMLKIHKLGFRTEMHNLKMKKLLEKRPVDAEFSSDDDMFNAESIFADNEVTSETVQTELAY